ncbi:MAG: hypothetical protein K0U74_05540 [Alphaproteobacteria bacterium]|nr:hypothetical protein [Alphaproteobacteria bacterium]
MSDERAARMTRKVLFSQLSCRAGVAVAMLSVGVLLIVIAGGRPDRPTTYPVFAQQSLDNIDSSPFYEFGVENSQQRRELDTASPRVQTQPQVQASIKPRDWAQMQPAPAFVLRPAFNGSPAALPRELPSLHAQARQ